MNTENNTRFQGVKIETINAMKDKADYAKSLVQKVDEIERQYETDVLKRIEDYCTGKLVVTLNLLIAAMGIALAAVSLTIMYGKGFPRWLETALVFAERFVLFSIVLLVTARFGAWIRFTYVRLKKADEHDRRKKMLFRESNAIIREVKDFNGMD